MKSNSKDGNQTQKKNKDNTSRPNPNEYYPLLAKLLSGESDDNFEDFRSEAIKRFFENQEIFQRIISKRLPRIEEHQKILQELEKKILTPNNIESLDFNDKLALLNSLNNSFQRDLLIYQKYAERFAASNIQKEFLQELKNYKFNKENSVSKFSPEQLKILDRLKEDLYGNIVEEVDKKQE